MDGTPPVELMRDVRRTGLLVLAKVVVLVLVSLSLYGFGTFVQSTALAVDRRLSDRADVDLYTIIDRFTGDPDGFERFRASEADVDRLAAFVDTLDEQQGITRISAYDQPLVLTDPPADDRFDVGYGTEYTLRGEYHDERGRTVRDVKSVQLDEQAWDFAGLEVAEGTEPSWDAVDYGRSVPVVLGADYAGRYSIGDELSATLLFRELRLVVTGFLRPDADMYFRGDLEHHVDDAVLLPYPPRLAGLARSDLEFAGLLGFQVLNGDLAVDRDLTVDDVLASLGAIGAATGFTEYSLTGVPTYVVQLASVRQLVQDNLQLLGAVLVLIVLAGGTASAFLGRLVAARRLPVWSAYWVTGRDTAALVRMWAPLWLAEHVVGLVGFTLVCSVLPNRHGVPFLTVLAFGAVWAAIDAGAQFHAVARATSPRSGVSR